MPKIPRKVWRENFPFGVRSIFSTPSSGPLSQGSHEADRHSAGAPITFNTKFVTEVTCYGGCRANPGPRGIGIVVRQHNEQVRVIQSRWGRGRTADAAIWAALVGLRSLDPCDRVLIRTNSEEVVEAMIEGFRRPIHEQYWKNLDVAVSRHGSVGFLHVKADQNDPDSDWAYRLAYRAIQNAAD
jgi:ribonuclease HI